MQNKQQPTNTTAMNIVTILFHAFRVFMLLGFTLISAIFIPAAAFLYGCKHVVGYEGNDPHDFGTAVFITVFWFLSLLVNLFLPYMRNRSRIKPGTWHSGS